MNNEEIVYTLEYPNGGLHAMYDLDERESMWGILCCRDKEIMVLWLMALNIKGQAKKCKVVRTSLGDIADKHSEGSYTIWILDQGYEDREIIFY
jgi:hypothetical protein